MCSSTFIIHRLSAETRHAYGHVSVSVPILVDALEALHGVVSAVFFASLGFVRAPEAADSELFVGASVADVVLGAAVEPRRQLEVTAQPLRTVPDRHFGSRTARAKALHPRYCSSSLDCTHDLCMGSKEIVEMLKVVALDYIYIFSLMFV
jgi:hypothetical protein